MLFKQTPTLVGREGGQANGYYVGVLDQFYY